MTIEEELLTIKRQLEQVHRFALWLQKNSDMDIDAKARGLQRATAAYDRCQARLEELMLTTKEG